MAIQRIYAKNSRTGEWGYMCPSADVQKLEAAYADRLISSNELSSQPQTPHAEGCWAWGPQHYGCALEEIRRLQTALLVKCAAC